MISEEIVSEGSIHRCGSIPSSSHPALGNHNLISVSVFTFSKMSVGLPLSPSCLASVTLLRVSYVVADRSRESSFWCCIP